MTTTKPALWTPLFITLCVAYLGAGLVFYLTMATTASYAAARYGVGPGQAALATSAFLVGGVLGRPIAGWALSHFGERRLLRIAPALYALTTAAYFVTSSYASLLTVRLLNGIGFGVTTTVVAGAVMLTVPPSRRGEGAGWSGAGIALASGLGPFLGIILANGPLGMTGAFALITVAAVACAVLTLVAARRVPDHVPHAEGHTSPVEKRALPIAAVVMLCALPFSAVLAFLNGFTQGTTLAAAAAWYFPLYAAALLITRPIAGRLQDARGDDIVLIPAALSLVAGTALTAWAPNVGVLLLGGFLLGAGYGTLISAGQAFAVARTPHRRAGVAVGSFFLLVDFGTGLGPAVLGPLVPGLGYQGVIGLAAASAVLALVAYLLVVRRQPRYVAPPKQHAGVAGAAAS